MAAPVQDASLLRVSTLEFPEPERMGFWRDVFARQMCHLDFEHLSDGPLDVDAELFAWSGLRAGWFDARSSGRWSRTPDLVKDGDDSFALLVPLKGSLVRSQLGREVCVGVGEGVGILHSEPGAIEFRQLDEIAIVVPRSALAAHIPDIEGAASRPVPSTNDALRLLCSYLFSLRTGPPVSDPAVANAAVSHVHDLMALALGAAGDAAMVAKGRGMRAARLRAVKADIARNLTSRDLSITSVAVRERVTPRYIHMLFEDEGTTYSQHVLAQRLAYARRLLEDPKRDSETVASIAYASGFGDLSHFNHAFRRRFGATPTELRREAKRKA